MELAATIAKITVETAQIDILTVRNFLAGADEWPLLSIWLYLSFQVFSEGLNEAQSRMGITYC